MDLIHEHGGLIGIALVIILLLVKELVTSLTDQRKVTLHHPNCLLNDDKYMTRELCMERHQHLESKVEQLHTDIREIKGDLKDLPRKLNGGSK